MTEFLEHEYWMNKALGLAYQAEAMDEVPVGAIIVKDNQLIAEGYNQPITTNDACAHAEIVAIRAAGKLLKNYRLPNTTLYVTLEPCAMCAMAIVHARIEHLVFATQDPRTGAAGSIHQLLQHPAHNHQVKISQGVLASQSSQLLKDFFKKRR